MINANKDCYDAVIIGAGLSGLVCGCYLAKAGMKVLIAEQHFKPGGYCTSFKRSGFVFDAAAHSFGGYRENGIVRRVFTDLGVDNLLTIKRCDPSDTISTPDYRVTFWANLDNTIAEFQNAFPEDSNNIKKFFSFLIKPDTESFAKIRRMTFKQLLDQYFTNNRLQAILSFPIFGNGGLPPSLMSAFIGSRLFAEFLLDGGYYPTGGMQALPAALAERLKEFGGGLLLSCGVKKIKIQDNKVSGVFLENGDFIQSKYVISNCDARQTFLKLLGKKKISKEFLNKLNSMIPSLSMFVIYLGISKDLATLPKPGCNAWFLPHYSIDNMYLSAKKRTARNIEEFMLRVSPEGQSVMAMIGAPFRHKGYWDNNKNKLLDAFIKKIEQHVAPDLSGNIVYKDAATPFTLFRYTLNYQGSAYGWESILSQFADSDFKKPSFIQNLYLTGHWTTQGLGIPGVIYNGHNVAHLLIKKKKSCYN